MLTVGQSLPCIQSSQYHEVHLHIPILQPRHRNLRGGESQVLGCYTDGKGWCLGLQLRLSAKASRTAAQTTGRVN